MLKKWGYMDSKDKIVAPLPPQKRGVSQAKIPPFRGLGGSLPGETVKSLLPAYTHGTHRLLSPEQTLAQINSHLTACGITRCAEVTGLDLDLGVPTYCAIRPAALVLQTSNGKGLTRLSARVSALMEAIELFHAENPHPQRLLRASRKALAQQGLKVISPEGLSAYHNRFFSNDYVIDWVLGEDLISQERVWLPASAVYFCEPSLYRTSTNGLASGNHPVEATLHALYELIERDAISRLDVNGRLQIKERCQVIDTTTIADEALQHVIHRIAQAQNKVVLLWVPSCVPVHTFWAILLNQAPFSAVSTFNVGYGTHLDLKVAAARAITEAVQSRLTLVHGSREDIIAKPVYTADNPESSPAYAYFDRLEGDTSWSAIAGQVSYENYDLEQSYTHLLSKLLEAGHDQIIQVNLTNPSFNIPVVKVIVPSLQFKRKLF